MIFAQIEKCEKRIFINDHFLKMHILKKMQFAFLPFIKFYKIAIIKKSII
ncbi:MAG: hypothetical protein CNLJKLNK_01375 [Holosporales bacterium]